MDLIHFILNAAAMLLWLSWRSYRFVPANDFRGGTLLSTLKKTERGQRQVSVHYAWRGGKSNTSGRALQWWLQQLESPATRAALLENHRSM